MSTPQSTRLHCTGVPRRQVIQAGLGGLLGLALPEVLRLQAASAATSIAGKDTAVIYVTMSGGPSQFETYDPKPDAPPEIRGEFSAIGTNIPGVAVCELMARQARVMNRLTILRGIHHPSTQHSSSVHLMQTGYYCSPPAEVNEMPSIGSYVARLRGPKSAGIPPYVVLPNEFRYTRAMWVGGGNDPFTVRIEPNDSKFHVPNLTLIEGIASDRLNDRRTLLTDLDRARRVLDNDRGAEALDQFTRRAFNMVTGPAARRAFDLDQEPPAVRDRYGRTEMGQRMLLARRLVEQGVTFVTLGTMGWDHHGNIVKDMKREAPAFDQALAALVEDIFERGLHERVLVVALGEFGRAPRMSVINNSEPGRDHWGDAMSVLLAGGGLPAGAVIGGTDSQGSRPVSGAYRLECVLAHMYRHLGIDPGLTFADHNGRPRHLLEIRDPIRELG